MRKAVEKLNSDTHNKKKIKKIVIPVVAITLVVGAIGTVTACNILRTKKINNQVLQNIDDENMTTTIFCSGNNINLSSNVYNTLKENGYDLTIYNNNYIAKIANENIEEKMNLGITTKKYEEFNNVDAFTVEINGTTLKELKVKSKIEKDYLSEFILNDIHEFVKNDCSVENGYVNIKLNDNQTKYILAYITPENINVEDIQMNKGESKQIELGLEDKDYTLGSVRVSCNDEEAISIDSKYMIVANKVGEYMLTYSTDKESKEAKVNILQSVEKIELSKLTIELVEGATEKIEFTITPDNAVNKELTWTSSDESVATVDNDGNITAKKAGNCEIIVATTQQPKIEAAVMVEVKEKPTLSSLLTPPEQENVQGITYINGIMLVNKTHSIPQDYNPGLNDKAYQAFLQLQAGANAAGFDMPLLSGFRSYTTQKGLYERYCQTYGQAEADTFSARPGTSEHQTGLAMDVGQIEDWYGDTEAGKWLAANCYKYGFIIRYPLGKENITGYKYEPWHIRYLGVDIATKVYNSGLTLEEYLGVI